MILFEYIAIRMCCGGMLGGCLFCAVCWSAAGVVADPRMAAMAVVHRESDPHVTGAAEPSENILVHGEGLGSFLLDVEYLGMATGAVEFRVMLFVGKCHIAVRGGGAELQGLLQVVGELQGGVITG